MRWLYALCAITGLALGLCVLGPRICGPRAFVVSLSLTAGDAPISASPRPRASASLIK